MQPVQGLEGFQGSSNIRRLIFLHWVRNPASGGVSFRNVRITMNRNSAFTLFEIVITIVILSFIVSMALPRYLITIEKTKTAEAMNILTALKDAQILYKYENGVYTATPGDLDVTIPTPSNFNDPTAAAADPIASIQRKTGAPYDYTLTIDANGAIKCAEVSPAGICANVGCSGVGGECN